MLSMIIASFKHGDPVPVSWRFRDHGRLAPEGLRYVSSWVTSDLTRCYQRMECDDRRLLEQWLAHWPALGDFEVIPVMTSAQAAERVASRLSCEGVALPTSWNPLPTLSPVPLRSTMA